VLFYVCAEFQRRVFSATSCLRGVSGVHGWVRRSASDLDDSLGLHGRRDTTLHHSRLLPRWFFELPRSRQWRWRGGHRKQKNTALVPLDGCSLPLKRRLGAVNPVFRSGYLLRVSDIPDASLPRACRSVIGASESSAPHIHPAC